MGFFFDAWFESVNVGGLLGCCWLTSSFREGCFRAFLKIPDVEMDFLGGLDGEGGLVSSFAFAIFLLAGIGGRGKERGAKGMSE